MHFRFDYYFDDTTRCWKVTNWGDSDNGHLGTESNALSASNRLIRSDELAFHLDGADGTLTLPQVSLDIDNGVSILPSVVQPPIRNLTCFGMVSYLLLLNLY
jgi:hypothetical protein